MGRGDYWEGKLQEAQPAKGHDPILVEGGIGTAAGQLLKEMKRTKGVRFNAAKRLEKREANFTRIIAAASVGVIILTLLPSFLDLPAQLVSVLNLTTVAFSIVILALTLLQASAGDSVKAEQFHRCALEINTLRRELRATQVNASETLLAFSKRYDEILHRYSVNHDPVDLERYKIEHPDEFPEHTAGDIQRLRKDISAQTRTIDWAFFLITAFTAAATIAAFVTGAEPMWEMIRSFLAR